MADDDAKNDRDDDTDDDAKDDAGSGKGSGQKPEAGPEVKRALIKAHKEAEALRLKLKEIEDRDKSETDKLKDRVTVAEKRAEEAEARALRLEVAAEKGLTLRQAKRLTGASREELEADADELLEDLGASANGSESGARKAPAGKPKEKLRPTASAAGGDDEPDISKVADLVYKQARGGL